MLKVKLFGLSDIAWKRQLPTTNDLIDNIKFIKQESDESYDYLVISSSNEFLAESFETLTPREKRIFISSEPATYQRYNEDFLKQFGTVIMNDPKCKHDNIIRTQGGLHWHVGAFSKEKSITSFDKLKSWKPKKNKLCSVISSNNALTLGHLERLKFIEQLKNEFGSQIDFFGKEYSFHPPFAFRGMREIDDKIEALENYRYHIVLENSTINDYWSEKVADPFLALCYPIYNGCNNLEQYFNPRSFTRIDIKKPKEAFQIIRDALNSDLDKARLEYIKKSKRQVMEEHNIFYMVKDIVKGIEHSSKASQLKHKETIYPETFFINKTSWVRRMIPRLKPVYRAKLKLHKMRVALKN